MTTQTARFPRVTYANTGVDLSALHDYLDERTPQFKAQQLGRTWANYIDGSDDRDGTPFIVKSPIDKATVIGTFVTASAGAVDRAVKAAHAAFPAWAALGWQGRTAILRRWAALLEQRKYDFALAALQEVGKSRVEALGEADEVIDMVRYYCSEIERHQGYTTALNRVFPNEETQSVLRPLGAFAIIAPFNYPAALLVGMSTGALLTGNTAVIKPSSGCTLTARFVIDTLNDAGLPKGVANLVAGHNETGDMLAHHPLVAGIAFTGSHATGMKIFRQANAGRFAKPVIAEMGGKNPAYVTAHADLDAAAQGVARSAYGLQGQKCSACSAVYVHRDVKDEFVRRLEKYAASLVVGNPEDRRTFMGPVYNAAAAERMLNAVRDIQSTGKLLFGGKRADGVPGGDYFVPTLVEVDAGHPLTRDELFLPLLALRTFHRLSDALAEGNEVSYGLSAGIYTRDDGELQLFLNTAQAGALYANRPSGATTGAWPGVQSFCGWKGSGVTSKGGLGPHYLPQFMREQSHTILR